MVSYLSPAQQIEAINLWQKFDSVQIFKCTKNINHGHLEVCNKNGFIFLYCRQCGYVETNIPEVVYHKYYLLKDIK
jgi:predicted nucleic-acid-binding Zn-ribbon protein